MGSKKKNVARDISNVAGPVHLGDITHIHNTIQQEKTKPKELTIRIPYLNKNEIVGRDSYLDNIREVLLEKREAVVINGFGGVGKTTIAQVYAHTYWNEYAHIAWVSLSDINDDFKTDFLNAEGLTESLGITTQGLNGNQIFERIMVEIKRINDKPNLLILDNASNTIKKIKSYLPSTHDWHILLTSREEINGFTPYYLDFLDEPDAMLLFKHYYKGNILTEQDITHLLKEVEYHTLTIEILAKTADNQQLPYEKLMNALKNDIRVDVETARSDSEKINKITTYLSSIFALIGLNERETWLLKNIVCLPADYHSYQLLFEVIDPISASQEDYFAETIKSLVKKSWLQYNKETDSYKMHVVVAEVLKKKEIISFNDISGLVIKLSTLLYIDQNLDNPINKFKWGNIGKNVPEILQISTKNSVDDEKEIAAFLSNLGVIIKYQGDFEEAKFLMNSALLLDEKNFGSGHPTTLTRYSNLGLILMDMGDFTKAKSILSKAKEGSELLFGCNHLITATRYSNLALVHKALGDFKLSETFLKKAIIINENILGTASPETAISYSNLADVLLDQGRYQEALIYSQNALMSDENSFDSTNPIIALRYNNFAMILKALGDYEGAISLLIKAVELDEKNYGEDHPSTAIKYSNLATLLKDVGFFEKSEVFFKKTISINQKFLGSEHPDTIKSYNNLGAIYHSMGEYQKAQITFESVILLNEKKLGLNHFSTAQGYANLASVLNELGDYEKARKLLKKSIKSDKLNFGSEHPKLAIRYTTLSIVLNNLKNYPKAKEFMFKAYHINEKIYGADHPTRVKSFTNLISLLIDLNEIREAIFLTKNTFIEFKNTLPENHPNIKTVEDIYNYLKSLS